MEGEGPAFGSSMRRSRLCSDAMSVSQAPTLSARLHPSVLCLPKWMVSMGRAWLRLTLKAVARTTSNNQQMSLQQMCAQRGCMRADERCVWCRETVANQRVLACAIACNKPLSQGHGCNEPLSQGHGSQGFQCTGKRQLEDRYICACVAMYDSRCVLSAALCLLSALPPLHGSREVTQRHPTWRHTQGTSPT